MTEYKTLEDDLFISLESVMSDIGQGVIHAQNKLDLTSLKIQNEINKMGDDSLGLQATWYAIPETDIEVRFVFSKSNDGQIKTSTFNAFVQNRYSIESEFTNGIRIKIMAVPKPK